MGLKLDKNINISQSHKDISNTKFSQPFKEALYQQAYYNLNEFFEYTMLLFNVYLIMFVLTSYTLQSNITNDYTIKIVYCLTWNKRSQRLLETHDTIQNTDILT